MSWFNDSEEHALARKGVKTADVCPNDHITAMNKSYQQLSGLSVLALEGLWRRYDIGPISDRPKGRDLLIDDIMMYRHDDEYWSAKIKD